jgi:hypothetical protein
VLVDVAVDHVAGLVGGEGLCQVVYADALGGSKKVVWITSATTFWFFVYIML